MVLRTKCLNLVCSLLLLPAGAVAQTQYVDAEFLEPLQNGNFELGCVHVETSPDDAHIYANGIEQDGRSPFRCLELPEGVQELRAYHDDLDAWSTTRRVTVVHDQTASVRLIVEVPEKPLREPIRDFLALDPTKAGAAQWLGLMVGLATCNSVPLIDWWLPTTDSQNATNGVNDSADR